MAETTTKVTLREAAEGVAGIVEKHLQKLRPEEQEERMERLRKSASKNSISSRKLSTAADGNPMRLLEYASA